MLNIVLFSQHLILDSLIEKLKQECINGKIVFLTTQFLFEHERAKLNESFPEAEFRCFADFLTDEDMAKCDEDAFIDLSMSYDEYLCRMKKMKNRMVLDKVNAVYQDYQGFIFCDDLGIDSDVWIKAGFKWFSGEYYYPQHQGKDFKNRLKKRLKKYSLVRNLYGKICSPRKALVEDVYVAYYEGKKYIFIGRMNRIDYRLAITFTLSKEEKDKFNRGEYEEKETCQYLTTWHEHWKCTVPDDSRYDVRWIQDGYLPPNYTDYSYDFIPKNVQYYAWDILGTKLFKNRNLPVSVIPFRKKLYMPKPSFPKEVKHVLIVASGSGDWTALKNRSDDDILVYAFAQMAKRFPKINFVYRCHPTWIHPLNVGVHAIARVQEYFSWLNLPNLHVSAHIPIQTAGEGDFKLTFPRSSLEEDLTKADFVFGEHSISMVDAAFKQLPFASVNLTKRRNFFCGIADMGFPACEKLEDIVSLLTNVTNENFQHDYLKAVDIYNRMTDEEAPCN